MQGKEAKKGKGNWGHRGGLDSQNLIPGSVPAVQGRIQELGFGTALTSDECRHLCCRHTLTHEY